MIIELSTDMSLINSILKDPYIWDKIAEDGIDPEAFYPSYSPKSFWLTAKTNEICGLIFVVVDSTVSITIHPYMLKAHKGKGFYMMKAFLAWYLENTIEIANKINAKIPTYNKIGKKIALKLGFAEEGTNRQSHIHQGTIYDQWLLGITRNEVKEVLKWAT